MNRIKIIKLIGWLIVIGLVIAIILLI